MGGGWGTPNDTDDGLMRPIFLNLNYLPLKHEPKNLRNVMLTIFRPTLFDPIIGLNKGWI